MWLVTRRQLGAIRSMEEVPLERERERERERELEQS